MLRPIAAAVFSLMFAHVAFADSCSDKANKIVNARFGGAFGVRVYTDPDTPALPIAATIDDAATLVVSGGQSFLFKGRKIGVVDGYKAVGQFNVRGMQDAAYRAELRHCATPVFLLAQRHRHRLALTY